MLLLLAQGPTHEEEVWHLGAERTRRFIGRLREYDLIVYDASGCRLRLDSFFRGPYDVDVIGVTQPSLVALLS